MGFTVVERRVAPPPAPYRPIGCQDCDGRLSTTVRGRRKVTFGRWLVYPAEYRFVYTFVSISFDILESPDVLN